MEIRRGRRGDGHGWEEGRQKKRRRRKIIKREEEGKRRRTIRKKKEEEQEEEEEEMRRILGAGRKWRRRRSLLRRAEGRCKLIFMHIDPVAVNRPLKTLKDHKHFLYFLYISAETAAAPHWLHSLLQF